MDSALERVLIPLRSIPSLSIHRRAPLSLYTRFAIGGPASILVETENVDSFLAALGEVRENNLPHVIIGAGTNLIVSDAGFSGVVLKFSGHGLASSPNVDGTASVRVEAGAVLQSLVDFTIELGLDGLHTMTGIPGFTGAAVYGNAGAYGHSISEFVDSVSFYDGTQIRRIDNAGCEFHYRDSIFKRRKEWIILAVALRMKMGDAVQLRQSADKILSVRNAKYPPAMKCAGSIFKNYLLRELPPAVAQQIPASIVIEGKVPSAWFLEQVGAKGMKSGDIHVADYHANLIYNAGSGTARDLMEVIRELKSRIWIRWKIPLEEEVQYVGFAGQETAAAL